MSSTSRKLFRILALLAFGFPASYVRGDNRDDTVQFLRKNLRGKIVLLRHFYGGERLKFDAEGNLKKGRDVCAWTVCAQIEIREVNLRSDKLEIKGRRILVQYNGDVRNPSGLNGLPVSIDIEVTPNTVEREVLSKSLNKVFLWGNEQLAEVVPSYWKQFLLSNSSEKKATDTPFSLNGQPVQKSEVGKVSPPRKFLHPRLITRVRPAGPDTRALFFFLSSWIARAILNKSQ